MQESERVTITLRAFAPSCWPHEPFADPPMVRRIRPEEKPDVSRLTNFGGLVDCGGNDIDGFFRRLRPLYAAMDEDILKYGPPESELLTAELDQIERVRDYRKKKEAEMRK